MTELFRLTATALVEGYARGDFSPVDATEACLRRIAQVDPVLNAFVLVDAERALADARASEARWAAGRPQGLVDGVPTTIKDLYATRGWPTLKGSRTVDRDQPWDTDAPAVARLREHGAVLLGKTTTTEFGHKGVGDSPLTGITRNPWNTGRTPGGSSCGAAVAAAACMAPLNLGGDGGGSIRIPASFSGVFGIKPGYGRVPSAPAGMIGSMSASGPLARSVADAAALLQVICGDDPRDWMTLPEPAMDLSGALERGVRGLRIAHAPTFGDAPVDPDVARAVDAAAERFRELGAQVDTIAFDLPGAHEVYYAINSVAFAHTLAQVDEARRPWMDQGLRVLAADGARISAVDYATALHQGRARIGAAMRALHMRYDLLLTPAVPTVAFDVGLDFPGDRGGQWRADWTPFAFPFNLTSQPACSIPCGLDHDGMPIGLQIVGRRREEALVLAAARAFERAHPWHLPAFDFLAPAAPGARTPPAPVPLTS
ncbi:amidase [Xylophilus sp. GOD-11R]|uniref:amidase n=1 Tax=Xylophilus sp. GOD-11R TaxID=3089814 RepID=UPI00298C0EA3|nr:amidase [Xylophilus sp. GOD-11R]WPB55595.1 amidase [Xylophilus sp. GOD-11R]